MGEVDSLRHVPRETIVKCDWCGRTAHRFDTLILYNRQKRRNLRLCRDCQFKQYMGELKEKNPGIDIKLRIEKFAKGLKEGSDLRR